MTDTATEVTTSDTVDLSDFSDMWADAAAAETAGDDGATDTLEVTPEILTGLEDTDTDAVEGEIEVPQVADKPEGESDEWDWSANADKLVPIKVRGEETSVPLKELRDGYMRQQDYTRGTQEIAQARQLAQWAQDVQRGFEVDPVGMIESFARAFKVELGAEPQPDPLDEVDEDLRPVYQQNRQLQAQLEEMHARQSAFEDRIEQERVLEGVKRELETLKQTFGDAFDPRETIQVAQHYNLPLLEAHYLRMARTGAATPQAPASPPAATPVVDTSGAEAAAEAARLAGKQVAVGTVPNRRLKASEIAVDDFNDIGELFEIVSKSS